MEMTGEQRIPAPQTAVWAALNDPDVLRQCIPGCESLSKLSDTDYEATVATKVGPVSARFKGKVKLSDVDAPNGYTIAGEGQGGVAGFGKGSAEVSLRPDGSDTVLTYRAKAQVGGKLAQIGSRLVDAAAAKMAGDFFSRFNEIVAAAAMPRPEPAPDATPTPAGSLETPAPEVAPLPIVQPRALPAWTWIGGLIVLVLVILYFMVGR